MATYAISFAKIHPNGLFWPVGGMSNKLDQRWSCAYADLGEAPALESRFRFLPPGSFLK